MHGHQKVDGSSVLAGGACWWWAWLWAGEAGLPHQGTSAISFSLFSWADEILQRRLVQSSAWRGNICLPSFWGSSWEEAEGFKLWDQTCVLSSCCQYGPWCSPRQRPSISSSPENKSAPLLWVVGRAVTWLQGCRRYLEYLAASQTDIQSVLVGFFFLYPFPEAPGLPVTEVWGWRQGALLLHFPHRQLRLLSWDCHHSSCLLASQVVLLFSPLLFIWTASCVFEKPLYCHFSMVWWGRSAKYLCSTHYLFFLSIFIGV